MTSVIIQGKYRQRKDGSASSIPTLVSLEEETSPVIEFHHNGNGNMLTSSPNGNNGGMPPKPPRRSSLAIGLLNSRLGAGEAGNSIGAADKTPHKRRSSIAVAFLGRYNKVGFFIYFY